ncbi:MAG TPA: SDR family oxidoreductase [Acidimicrobiales bacterium]|nr:SDR family oxidoreductase [Acidimicrobiales bacterium]
MSTERLQAGTVDSADSERSVSRTALVVGAASGIGESVAELLAIRDGWSVVAADVQETAGVVERIHRAGGRANSAYLDIADVSSIAPFLDRPEMEELHAVVIAASVQGSLMPLQSYQYAEWARVIGINLTGVFFCAQAGANRMARNGGGRLVLFGSPAGRRPAKSTIAPYIAAKAAMPALVAAFTDAFKSSGVLVAAVEPGRTKTPMIMGPVYQSEGEAITPDLPIERLLEASETAEVVAFLCSAAASGVTNAYWTVSSRT